MVHDHEYSLLGGINRAVIGRYITLLASGVSATLVFVVLTLVDLAKRFNLNVNVPPTLMSLIGAGVVFTILYAAFSRAVWKWPWAVKFLKVPDLSGEWECTGTTLDDLGNVRFTWQAVVHITQTWDKIRVRLKTAQSSSHSITAALAFDEADGYTLLYNYKNDPRPGEPVLRGHLGSANLLFSKSLDTASGDYFNGYGRPTYGRMELRKKHEQRS
ncbi:MULTISPECIES: hypothetical protein [unclassified Pseudomonas]|jgi:hypothetical protein|uniref:Cap15 family cyclic dinucleotide receptor domain-containing protein n=1 Tax=unclassified Pseudomonas TaxID=196821 RepID=UPI00224AA3E4|nr:MULTISPECIES: hypothetical protein [unclassified Pseudomonas]MCX2812470.1 hypothetical protein [Pseudomonas sp. DCB_E]MCX9140537.1 hypothetical protein [Pseudomonas sp. DCB_Q]